MGVWQVIQQEIQEMQETAITLVLRKFPELESLARVKITTINNWERLPQLFLDLTLLHTQEEMEQFLLRLHGDQKRIGARRRRVEVYDPSDSFCHWLCLDAFATSYSEALQQRIQEGTLEIQQAVQLSVEQGVELGIQRGAHILQHAAIIVVKRWFPELIPLAQRSITAVDDVQRLQQLILDLNTLSSQDEVKQYLLSLLANPLYNELLEDGVQEVTHAMQQAAMTAVAKRFPDSLRLAQNSNTVVGDSPHSQHLLPDLDLLPSQEQIEELLLSLLVEPRYGEILEDSVRELLQAVQQEATDCAESLQRKVQEDALDIQETIQDAVKQGVALGSKQGVQILRQAACAIVVLHFPKLESLARTKISVTNRVRDPIP